jgi:calreticulin
MEDARFYQVSAAFPEFSNKGKTLVLQFSVKHEQNIDCGGGYVKLLPAGLNQKDFNGDSEYNIMFGPDICGGTRRTHAIITYKGKNYLINGNVDVRTDEHSHIYTFIVNPDQTYNILIDNKSVKEGTFDDWDFLPPKEINDPSVSKPEDWVDERFIDDPEDVKPEGYDDIAQQIADPDAEQPEDWDTELDGEWEAPMIDNPEYKGPWRPKKIDNPAYKGEWVHPKIPNPDYYSDDNIYAFDSHAFIGIEIWQVKAGTIFDNFLVTDDVDLAHARAEEALERFKIEKEQYDADQAAAQKAREAEEAAAGAAEEDGEDEEAEDSKDEL